ncbi:hypothetical protein [Caulobacter segnis]|uniref:hypothetical protein n=1 Tax=Caulobacter segnis TaxID=88688 RepID=UPI0013004773|nr:hypothetical protein [Caulobacter segnis]
MSIAAAATFAIARSFTDAPLSETRVNWFVAFIVLALAIAAKFLAPRVFGGSSDLVGWAAAAVTAIVATLLAIRRRRRRDAGRPRY